MSTCTKILLSSLALASIACSEPAPPETPNLKSADQTAETEKDSGTSDFDGPVEKGGAKEVKNEGTGKLTTTPKEEEELAGEVDASETDGEAEENGPAPLPAATDHVVFVSSVTYAGNFASGAASATAALEKADQLCKALATAASLRVGRPWKAVLSASGVSASNRISVLGPISKTNGDSVTSGALFTSISSGINRNESGATQSGEDNVWTGSTASGGDSAINCSNWSSTSGMGSSGSSEDSDGDWIADDSIDCSAGQRLYCISQ